MSRRGPGAAWVPGHVPPRRGDLAASLASWSRAAGVCRRTGWRMNAVECLLHQGDTALALSDPAGARAGLAAGA